MTAAAILGACAQGEVGGEAIQQERAREIAPNALPEHAVIESDVLAPHKRSLTVRLQRKASLAELRALAIALREQDPRRFERTFIVYLLPGMTPGAGAWATTHFDPDLEVKIPGMSAEQEKAVVAKPIPVMPNEVLGNWVDEGPGLAARITLASNADSVFVVRVFADGSDIVQRVSRSKSASGTRYRVLGGTHGDHFIVNSNGDLEIRDTDGLIRTARRLPSGTAGKLSGREHG